MTNTALYSSGTSSPLHQLIDWFVRCSSALYALWLIPSLPSGTISFSIRELPRPLFAFFFLCCCWYLHRVACITRASERAKYQNRKEKENGGGKVPETCCLRSENWSLGKKKWRERIEETLHYFTEGCLEPKQLTIPKYNRAIFQDYL